MLLSVLIDPGPVPLGDQILDARLPIALVIEPAVRAGFRVAFASFELRRCGEHIEHPAPKRRRHADVLSRPSDLDGVAAMVDFDPPSRQYVGEPIRPRVEVVEGSDRAVARFLASRWRRLESGIDLLLDFIEATR